MLVLAVPEDLDKLLEDGRLAAATPLGELCRVVVVAVDVAVVLVVAVRGPKYGRAQEQVKWSTWYLRSSAVMYEPRSALPHLWHSRPEAAEVVGLAKADTGPPPFSSSAGKNLTHNLSAVLETQCQRREPPGVAVDDRDGEHTRHLKQSR